MQNTSATWKGLLASGNARLETRAVIGETAYTQMSAPVIARALTQGGLSIGNVVSASCQLTVIDQGSIPRAAEVAVEMRLTDGTTASEWLPAGTFYISHRSRDAVNGLLTLMCFDALLKANAVWEPSAGSWPRNMSAVAEELRGLLGIQMDSRTAIPVGGLYVMNQPTAGATIRDVLGQIGQACGGNWIVTPANALRLVPVVSASGAAGATGNVVDVAGVTGSMSVSGTGTVTGIRNTWEDVTDLVGTEDGLVLETQLVPLLAAELGEDVLGATYQAYELGGAVYDPAAELGDYVRAGANGEVASVLYAETATLGAAFRGSLSAPEAGELSDEYPYIGASQKALSLAKAYAREAAADAVEGLDDELTQQEIFNRLTDNGAAQGLVLYNGQLYVNASYIRSGTLVLGGLNDQNGLLQVLDANGNLMLEVNNQGIALGRGGAFTNMAAGSSTGVEIQNGIISFRYQTNDAHMAFESGQLEILSHDAPIIIEGPVNPDPNPPEGVSSRYLESKVFFGSDGQILIAYHDLTLMPDYDDSTIKLYSPLGIDSGGTGADNAADARTNLGITPANIGAVSTSDVIDVQHGGTDADNASDALLNLGASIYLDTATWGDIFNKLSKIPAGHTAAVYTSSAVGKMLTGNKVTIVLQGTVSRTTTNGTYTFFGAYGAGQNLYAWRISGLTSANATPTIGTVYQYTGTAI